MARSARGLLDQIEDGALNSETPLTDVLRKCVALGGRAGSEQLRDWARRELDGYKDGKVDLPPYRVVPAVIALDGQNLRWQVTGQQISTWDLPDFARDTIKQEAPLPYGIAELEQLAARTSTIQMQAPGMPDLVKLMNMQQGDYGTSIHSMYWKVDPTSVHGVLATVRTMLVSLVAEMRAVGVEQEPTAEAANQAVNVVVNGAKRSTINVDTNQAAGADESQAQTITQPTGSSESRRPSWITAPWAIATGIATIGGTVAGVAAWVGWNPFA